MFRTKRNPLTPAQKDLVLRIMALYGFGPGSIMQPIRARISADEPLIGNQWPVVKALLERAAELAGPDDAEALKVLIKRRWS